MSGAISIAALVLSVVLLAGMISVLVLLRKGEGPRYGASRAYDANRREALRVLTGEDVHHVPGDQWFDPARRRPVPDDPVAAPFRDAVFEALDADPPRRARTLARRPRAGVAGSGQGLGPAGGVDGGAS